MNFTEKLNKITDKVVNFFATKQETQTASSSNFNIDQYISNLIDDSDFESEKRLYPFYPGLDLHETECLTTIKRIMINYCGLEKGIPQSKVTDDVDFEDLSFSSLDRIDLIIFLERKYDIEFGDIMVGPNNTIRDLGDIVGRLVSTKYGTKYIKSDSLKTNPQQQSVKIGRKTMNLLPDTYKTKPDSVFYNVKQILLVQNNAKAVNLEPGMFMFKDLNLNITQIDALIKELEKRYNRAIFSHKKLYKTKTLSEFCTICANDLNKKVALQDKAKAGNIALSIKTFLVDECGFTKEELSDEKANLIKDLKLDSLDIIELVEHLQVVYNRFIGEHEEVYMANSIQEMAERFAAIFAKDKIEKSLTQKAKMPVIKNPYQKTINAFVAQNMKPNAR